MNRFEPAVWGLVIIAFAAALLIITTIADVALRLWDSRRHPTGPTPYDWHMDAGLLDSWARDEQGEVLTVGHLIQWGYK